MLGNIGIKKSMEAAIKVSPETFLKLHNREKALAMARADLSQWEDSWDVDNPIEQEDCHMADPSH